ncbi:hypothetical protein [Tepidiforma sp.]|uniref:hypothetical protein n=1 Tax=Tepidiforma sp. TaxID=2682230 RepID=UPI002ADDF86E|nr:hypothetical protein [Tepidiforma sp.]
MARPLLLVIFAAWIAAIAAGCRGEPERFTTRELPPGYQAVLDEVAATRGEPAPTGLRLGFVRRADLPELLQRTRSPDEAAWFERVTPVYRLLGLIGPGESLEAINRQLLTAAAGALYVPGRREIWLVSDGEPPASPADLPAWQRRLLAHEFAHALQDAGANLPARLAAAGTIDERLALLALLEGDATWTESQWTARSLLPALAPGAALEPPAADASEPPAILREWQFLYVNGAEWAAITREENPGAIAAVLSGAARLTTAEVLHPSLRATGWAPEEPPFPAFEGEAWRVLDAGTLGEFVLQNALRQRLPALAAVQAAAGWTGDRYAFVRGDGGDEALAVRARFRDAKEAGEFAARQREWLATAGAVEAGADAVTASLPDGRIVLQFEPNDRDVTFIIASSRSLAEAIAGVLRNQ